MKKPEEQVTIRTRSCTGTQPQGTEPYQVLTPYTLNEETYDKKREDDRIEEHSTPKERKPYGK